MRLSVSYTHLFRHARKTALLSGFLMLSYLDITIKIVFDHFLTTTEKTPRNKESGANAPLSLYAMSVSYTHLLSDKEFDSYCEKNGIDGVALSSDPGKYGYECRSMIFGIDGQAVDSISFTAVSAAKSPEASPNPSNAEESDQGYSAAA